MPRRACVHPVTRLCSAARRVVVQGAASRCSFLVSPAVTITARCDISRGTPRRSSLRELGEPSCGDSSSMGTRVQGRGSRRRWRGRWRRRWVDRGATPCWFLCRCIGPAVANAASIRRNGSRVALASELASRSRLGCWREREPRCHRAILASPRELRTSMALSSWGALRGSPGAAVYSSMTCSRRGLRRDAARNSCWRRVRWKSPCSPRVAVERAGSASECRGEEREHLGQCELHDRQVLDIGELVPRAVGAQLHEALVQLFRTTSTEVPRPCTDEER
jgi:hypothetical protein